MKAFTVLVIGSYKVVIKCYKVVLLVVKVYNLFKNCNELILLLFYAVLSRFVKVLLNQNKIKKF